MSYNVIAVEIDQKVSVDGKKVTVLKTCKISNGHWFCVTHQESFPTQINKDSHIALGGMHTLAWICHLHGVETP